MTAYFFYTSALVKYYHTEACSDVVLRVMHEPDARHYMSRLGVVETMSAFALKVRTSKVRTSEIDQSDFAPLRRRFLRDISLEHYHTMHLTTGHYQEAVRLIATYVQRPLRALDALLLSSALDLVRLGMLDRFVCADARLCEMAAAEHLAVLNPMRES